MWTLAHEKKRDLMNLTVTHEIYFKVTAQEFKISHWNKNLKLQVEGWFNERTYYKIIIDADK